MKIIINLRREILLLGSVRESIMTPSETSSENKLLYKLTGAKKFLYATRFARAANFILLYSLVT
jgi:hypothetical protein